MKYCLDCNESKSRKGNYCKKCGYKHRFQPKRGKGVYKLVKENPTKFKRGQKPWNFGKKSLEFNGKSKDGLHAWVERNLGKAKKCDKCKTMKSKIYQWSNISGEYKKDLTDWQRLCVKCHCKYDFENFGARKEFYKR